jgi:hypothetical protein
MRVLIACALVLAMALPCSAAYYAIDKGSIQLGGSIGFESWGGDLYEIDGDGQTLLAFEPFAGYFLMQNLLLGAHVEFTSESQGDYTRSVFGIGPVVRYYFGGEYSKYFPFIAARLDYRTTSVDFGDVEPPPGVFEDVTNMSYGFAGGLTTMVSKNVGIRAALFYMIDSEEPEDEDSVDGNRLGIRIGVESFIW